MKFDIYHLAHPPLGLPVGPEAPRDYRRVAVVDTGGDPHSPAQDSTQERELWRAIGLTRERGWHLLPEVVCYASEFERRRTGPGDLVTTCNEAWEVLGDEEKLEVTQLPVKEGADRIRRSGDRPGWELYWAHDVAGNVAFEPPIAQTLGIDPFTLLRVAVIHDTLCWVLGHDNNKKTIGLLRSLEFALDKIGYEVPRPDSYTGDGGERTFRRTRDRREE